MAATDTSVEQSLLSGRAHDARRRWRMIKDRLARYMVVLGGLGVVGALLLIFAYLFWVVLPLFESASIEPVARYSVPGPAEQRTAHLAMGEHADVGVRFTAAGGVYFFNVAEGRVVKSVELPLPAGVTATAFDAGDPDQRLIGYGLSDGSVVLARHEYEVSFPEGTRRVITPQLNFPVGEQPLPLAEGPLRALSVQMNDEGLTAVGADAEGQVSVVSYTREQNFLTQETNWKRQQTVQLPVGGPVTHLALDREQRRLYVVEEGGQLSYWNVTDKAAPKLVQRLPVLPKGQEITAIRFVAGGVSLLIASTEGTISQWFPVRQQDGSYRLQYVRAFDAQEAPITALAPEHSRRGFIAGDRSGRVGIYHTTAENTVLVRQVTEGPVAELAVDPRNNLLLVQDQRGQVESFRLHNEHPEISWSAIWGKVWYEGYQEPRYLWQSSSATDDTELKFSLTPIAFGTLKAAFYAMLFAVPLAIMGAIYTAYFMAPGMRKLVKPTIEVMEALPTVILGFLAGLWLAPVAEQNLPGFFALLLLGPPLVVAFAFLWSRLPWGVRRLVPEGWQAALMIPVILLIGAAAIGLGPWLEQWLFGGNARLWLTHELGIGFDQRNALVVGIAMGFAVIPTIFSIAEDAVFSVPKHLTFGALALGSTPWQALSRVVLLTASPGIFSAVMIGLGRAVGETMIVLMATGNTPVMDFNIFEGMRTLAANIAVEMPESEVGSTHYRILFLAGLVLFLFTFVANTVAEIVRQRLRRKYSSL